MASLLSESDVTSSKNISNARTGVNFDGSFEKRQRSIRVLRLDSQESPIEAFSFFKLAFFLCRLN